MAKHDELLDRISRTANRLAAAERIQRKQLHTMPIPTPKVSPSTLEALAEIRNASRVDLRARVKAPLTSKPREILSAAETADEIRFRTTVTETDGSGGGALPSISKDTIDKPLRTNDALSLFRVVPIDSDDVQVATRGARAVNAAPTSYGTTVPSTSIVWTKVPLASRWFPVSSTITKGAWEDGTVAEAVTSNAIDEVRAAIESDVMAGDGTGQHLTGFLNTSSVLTQARSTDPRILAILKGAAKVRAASNDNYGRDGLAVILSSADAATIAEEVTTGGAEYALSDAQASLALLNVRQFVISPFLTAGTSVVCDPTQSTVYVRNGVTVAEADSHSDHFVLGLVDVLTSARVGWRVEPKSVCLVTGM